MNNTATALEAADDADAGDGTDGGFEYGFTGFAFGLLVFVIILTYGFYICKRRLYFRRQSSTQGHSSYQTTSNGHHNGGPAGINEDVLVTFPTLLYSEVKPHLGDVDGSGCAICLGDYKSTDMLRLLPECGHLFHLKCIDTWLKLHPTCPVCRNSPLPTPHAEVVPLSISR